MNKKKTYNIGYIEYSCLNILSERDDYMKINDLQIRMSSKIPRIIHFSQIREILRGLLHKKIIETKEGIFKNKIEDYSLKLMIKNNHSIRIRPNIKQLIPILIEFFEG